MENIKRNFFFYTTEYHSHFVIRRPQIHSLWEGILRDIPKFIQIHEAILA